MFDLRMKCTYPHLIKIKLYSMRLPFGSIQLQFCLHRTEVASVNVIYNTSHGVNEWSNCILANVSWKTIRRGTQAKRPVSCNSYGI
jgi:hypothetical protein